MAPDTQSAQTPHQIASPLKNNPFTQSALLPLCCLCGLIRDAKDSSPGGERWLTLGTYKETYDMKSDDVCFTHTYCPTCLTNVRETLVQYYRKIGASQ